jgi:hypothetical protein
MRLFAQHGCIAETGARFRAQQFAMDGDVIGQFLIEASAIDEKIKTAK